MLIENVELEYRKQVWSILSRFYLDTALVEGDYQEISRDLARLPYSLTEIKTINKYEVFPILKWNMLAVVGVWDAFDQDWLLEKCYSNFLKKDKIWFRLSINLQCKLFSSIYTRPWDIIAKYQSTNY